MAVAVIEDELVGARAWADRHGWALAWAHDQLRLGATTKHPATGDTLEIVAVCDGYRGIPPAWRFVTPGTDDSPRTAFPAPGGPLASIFHNNAVMCAPWNRLAYGDHGGPHGDWGGPAGWLAVPPSNTRAVTLGDMLAAIELHLGQSPGMMS